MSQMTTSQATLSQTTPGQTTPGQRPPDPTMLSPTARVAARQAAYWVVVGVMLLAFAATMGLISRVSTLGDAFSANESAPMGSRALVEVLRNQGVDVTTPASLDATLSSLTSPASGTTLVMADPRGIMTVEQWAQLDGLADTLLIIEPPAAALEALAPKVAPGVRVSAEVRDDAGCSLPAAQRAASITAGGLSLDVVGEESTQACFSGTGGSALVTLAQESGGALYLLGAGSVVQNGSIGQQGNAALALGLAGEHPHVVWYVASVADLDASDTSAADLFPGWVNPLAWLAVLVGLAAAVWRGRRLGPVVVENLPVTVSTTETMEGRARLYSRGGSRLRAIDALRVGALRRLAHSLGLGPAAGVDEIMASVASIVAVDRARLRVLLLDGVPGDDRELVRLSDELLELERHVARRIALSGPAPTV
jgi:hypothetical protein